MYRKNEKCKKVKENKRLEGNKKYILLLVRSHMHRLLLVQRTHYLPISSSVYVQAAMKLIKLGHVSVH